jgi:hypothetical protein
VAAAAAAAAQPDLRSILETHALSSDDVRQMLDLALEREAR